jgi:5'-3' exonuclease
VRGHASQSRGVHIAGGSGYVAGAMGEPTNPEANGVTVYLIDGTYELFRAYYGAPSAQTRAGREVAASRTLYRSLRLLWGQFPLAEKVTRALNIVTWSMIDFETDDALATFAGRAADDPRVAQVRITSPDKDFCQCVRGSRVVLYDRKKQQITDEAGVHARMGVAPAQVPALLALVGDTADGIPGIPRWGEKSAQAVLARYGSLDAIPDDPARWDIAVRGKDALARELSARREDARLYETLATLRYDVPLAESLDDLRIREGDPQLLQELATEIEMDLT